MGRFIWIFALVAVFGVHITLAQEPISFRSRALGGIISDDLDLVYDPVELRFVKGIRFYTNLSNLTSGEEQILNDLSDNEFLAGASWKNPLIFDLWTSFLVRFRKTRFSRPVNIDENLDGIIDRQEQGEFRNIYTAFQDTDFDGIYDVRRVIDQLKSNYEGQESAGLVLNNSLLLGDWTLGLQVIWHRTAHDWSTVANPDGMGTHKGYLIGAWPGDPSFTLDYESKDLEENFLLLQGTEEGDFRQKQNFSRLNLNFAIMKPVLTYLDTLELRADFAYSRSERRSRLQDDYSGSYELRRKDNPQFFHDYAEVERYRDVVEEDWNGFGVGFSLKRVFQKATERKNDGFWKVGVGVTYHSGDYNREWSNPFSYQDYFFDGSGVGVADFDDVFDYKNTNTDKGDGDDLNFFLRGRVNIPLGKKIYVGGGFSYGYDVYKRKTKLHNAIDKSQVYTQHDENPSNDYTRTETFNQTADRTYERFQHDFVFPVGIEYRFTSNGKWFLRFGSVFSFHRITMNDAKQITSADPHVTEIRYADNTTVIDIDDNIYQSTSSHQKNSWSSTRFYYGLGFNPTKYLQIDLVTFLGTQDGLSIFDAEFFRSLLFSFTLKL